MWKGVWPLLAWGLSRRIKEGGRERGFRGGVRGGRDVSGRVYERLRDE